MNVTELNRLLQSGKPASDIWNILASNIKQSLDASEYPVFLHSSLPKLCEVLFGGVGARSAYVRQKLSRTDAKGLMDFIAPEGTLMRAIMKSNPDPNALYEIYINLLPIPTQKVLQEVDFSKMPRIYENRVHVKEPAASSSPSKAPVGHLVPALGPMATPRVMLNMFEYYIMCFTYVVTLSTTTNPVEFAMASNPTSTAAEAANAIKHLFEQKTSTSSSSSYLDPIYFDVLQMYLDFYLPRDPKLPPLPNTLTGALTKPAAARPDDGLRARTTGAPVPPPKDAAGVSSAVAGRLQNALHWTTSPTAKPTASGSSQSASSGSASRKKENVYTISLDVAPQKRNDLCHAMSEFVVGACVEYWMSHNDYLEFQNITNRTHVLTYTQPSGHTLKGVMMLIQHVINMDLRSMSRTFSRDTGGQDVYYVCRRNAYSALGSKLYGFLQLALKYWPDDEQFGMIVDMWLTYITPWRVKATGAGVDQEWLLFVAENYVYYAGLLKTFLQRAERFDLASTARPVIDAIAARRTAAIAATAQSGGAAPNPTIKPRPTTTRHHLQLLQRVLSTFTETPHLLDALRDIETTLGSYTEVNTFDRSGLPTMAPVGTPANGGVTPFNSALKRSAGTGGLNMQKQASLLAVSLKFPELGNAGPVIKSSIQALEGTSDWKPIFSGSVDPDVLQRRLALLNRISFETSRLKAYMEQNVTPTRLQPETPREIRRPSFQQVSLMSPGSSISTPSTPTPLYRASALPPSLRSPVPETPGPAPATPGTGNVSPVITPPPQSLYNTLPERPPSDAGALAFIVWIIICSIAIVSRGWEMSLKLWQSVKQETENRSPKKEREQRTQILSQVNTSLEGTSALIRRVWDLAGSSSESAMSVGAALAAESSSVFGGQQQQDGLFNDFWVEEEEEGVSRMYGPNCMYAPEVRADNPTLLTRRGRMQIRKGLRLCDPATLPIRPSARAETMPHTYEFELLVRLTMWMSRQLEIQWDALRETTPYLPKLRFTFLRIFAAKPNLAFFALVYIAWWVVSSFWSWISMGSTTTKIIQLRP
ncbi:sphingomyelin phosphodiesterase [Synchytrium microbalum]|uniref:Sphingomyelin phosphodiesterase n=1 Tax=Synchytrium microbalum TaxID=1806994 RepID=A0A507C444_9FUNG|nr:sphingomyelin phosphodiesterase [Synchytrium microbalum]TPX32884.1 sphingomyelin phosphodiesterase [Synchytrium microbalum]